MDNMRVDHPALRFREVRAASVELKTVREIPIPPSSQQYLDMDLLNWLGALFCFQKDNVWNQQEHIILLLVNSQMRLQLPPDDIALLEDNVVRKLIKKILIKYDNWCAYLAQKSNVWISDNKRANIDERRELLYISLYLLIWGEVSNSSFMLECLSYIFHHMDMDLNRILEDNLDESTRYPSYVTTQFGMQMKRVEMYGLGNSTEVADHVGTKKKSQYCGWSSPGFSFETGL
jgi:callose synthase